jgi:hypothetical protein
VGGILSGRLIRFASTASALARRCRKSSPASGPWGAAAAVGEGGCEGACEGGCEAGCKGCFGNRFLSESEKRRSRPGALWGVDEPVPLSVRRVTGALLGRARLCASFFLWDDGGRLGGITRPARVKWLRPENRKRVRRAVHTQWVRACVKLERRQTRELTSTSATYRYHKTRSKGGAGAHTVHIQMNKNGTGPGVQRLKRGHPLAQNPRPADRRDAGARRGAPSIAL